MMYIVQRPRLVHLVVLLSATALAGLISYLGKPEPKESVVRCHSFPGITRAQRSTVLPKTLSEELSLNWRTEVTIGTILPSS
jgi:hypothetical protein